MMSAAPAVAVEAGEAAEKPKGKRKLILLAVPVLLIGLGAGGWFSGILPKLLGMNHAEAGEEKGSPEGKAAAEGKSGEAKGGKPGEAKKEAAEAKAAVPVFLDVPEIVANLNVGSRHASFVKLKAKLELAKPEDIAAVTIAMPRLLDLFQTYLRDMRPEELRGSAGSYRLREELLARASIATSPARITDVLFTELLVQ
jgi:flagellar FliL protein